MKHKDFGRKNKMDEYAKRTLEKLSKIKSAKDFKKALEKEISEWNLNAEDFNQFFYEQRNYVISILNNFNNEMLKSWGLGNLESTLEASKDELITFHEIHEFYKILKEQSNPFYEQYEKIIQEIIEGLDSEIYRRELNRDY